MPEKNYLKLETPLQYVKGVGPKLAHCFKTRDLNTVGDVIYFLPRAYRDNRRVSSISEIQPGRSSVLISSILKKNIIPLKARHKKIYEILIGDETGKISCKFFRSPYKGWFNSLLEGETVEVRGVASLYRNQLQFHHPEIFPIDKKATQNQEEDLLIPLYPEIESVSQNKIRSILKNIFENLDTSETKIEWLPLWLREKYQLIDKFKALKGLHFPEKNQEEAYLDCKTNHHRRLIFDEFFELQLYLALKKEGWKEGISPEISADLNLVKEMKKKLPFELTKAQQRVLEDILSDLKSRHPMHRLIQGDVGCGKTVVALMAALSCAKAGYQTAFMVPTEILAEQHYNNARTFLEPFGIKVEKLTGKMKANEKRNVNAVLNSGSCSVCIGTHALIQENVQFHNLGLVIIDEQHRFGSHQRALLKAKGNHPHFLVMTATPIPRTLSLAFYGDLETSIIDELPQGRQAIVTRRVFSNKRLEVFNFLKDQIQKGHQAYVIYPLVEESEKLDLKNVMDQYEKLKDYYKDLKWGILTGRMSSEEKLHAMNQFKNKEIDVLVSTTVIEVGIDIPNATVMVIEHSERFGLSQMHQLRGRVGRGSEKSYCILVLGEKFSKEAKQRAEIMMNTSDGFQIAEKDLELRGPGEFLGHRQSGLPTFKMAHLKRDQDILSLAKKAAFDLISRDPKLENPNHLPTKLKFKEISTAVRPG
ncbi:MAG: ATP-dependent DNA helicase RecG [Bdellovibrionales bacterium]